MATKKEETVPYTPSVVLSGASEYVKQELKRQEGLTLDEYAVAALESLDWNQIGMGQDEAAKLCWSMAQAMMRNKP